MASSTPSKRKREPPAEVSVIPPTPPSSSPAPEMRFHTSSPRATTSEEIERSGSPRTKVAYHFQGLQLDEPGDLYTPARLHHDTRQRIPAKLFARDELGLQPLVVEDEEDIVRKRVKILKGRQRKSGSESSEGSDREIPETPYASGRYKEIERKFAIVIGPERTVDPAVAERAKAVILSNEVDSVVFAGDAPPRSRHRNGFRETNSSIKQVTDTNSKHAKRDKSPPLFGSAEASLDRDNKSNGKTVADSASMTWSDHEITGHNLDDPDDDGEGINGIGFRPTPAEAYARAQRRRQQLAEYRNREAREARRMRSERRRASEVATVTNQERETARRVRFLEVELQNIIPPA